MSRGTRIAAAASVVGALGVLAGCGKQNTFVPPPPPRVTVASPLQQPITRYLEATGNAVAVNSANLVARVQGFVQEINYRDGDFVKKGTTLFVIEPESYKLKLQDRKSTRLNSSHLGISYA